jgi:hypothetical protein
MAMETWEHYGDYYCLQSTYVKSDDAWYFELSEARPALTTWSESPQAGDLLPSPAAVTVVAHNPSLDIPPTVYFASEQQIPFEVLTYFTELVNDALDDSDSDSDSDIDSDSDSDSEHPSLES